MKVLVKLPTLYSLSSKGKVKQWTITVEEEDGKFYLNSAHGYLNQTITCDYSSAIEGKNIGKKNETTPLQQAESEAMSKWQKKLDKNYSEKIPESVDEFVNLLPMLAQKYTERKHYVKLPCYLQPKLDGVRSPLSPVGDDMEFTSRGGKEYTTLEHLKAEIRRTGILGKYTLDGEIFCMDKSLQQINSAVKKLRPETLELQYWIYDVIDTTLTFEKRLAILEQIRKDLINAKCTSIVVVPTVSVVCEEDLMTFHKVFSKDYEGTMIRNADGMYVLDFRSNDLQKLKDFIDDEFEIIGGKEGSGNDEGTVVFRCKTKTDKEFDVRPRGSRDKRREWFEELESCIGKMLTVRYQNLSDDGIPVFPVGIAIRDYE